MNIEKLAMWWVMLMMVEDRIFEMLKLNLLSLSASWWKLLLILKSYMRGWYGHGFSFNLFISFVFWSFLLTRVFNKKKLYLFLHLILFFIILNTFEYDILFRFRLLVVHSSVLLLCVAQCNYEGGFKMDN